MRQRARARRRGRQLSAGRPRRNSRRRQEGGAGIAAEGNPALAQLAAAHIPQPPGPELAGLGQGSADLRGGSQLAERPAQSADELGITKIAIGVGEGGRDRDDAHRPPRRQVGRRARSR